MHPLITLSDSIQIPVYLLIISLVYCFSLIWVVRRAQQKDLNRNNALDIALAVMIGGLIGARGMQVFYEHPGYYLNHPLEIFEIWKGGFVFYGGAIIAVLSAAVVIYIKKLDFLEWADVYAPIAPIGYAFGRLGCFFNGCCYGKVCELPWAVKFPHLDGTRHPTQLYAFFIEIGLFLLIYLIDKNRNSKSLSWFKPKGQLFLLWLTGHSINRLFMEYFRADYRGDFIFGFSVSSWISLCVLFVASHFLFHRGRKFVFIKKAP